MKKKAVIAAVAVLALIIAAILGIRGCMAANADAAGYVQAQLDLTFQGETQEAQRFVDASRSDLEEIYESGIEAFVVAYLTAGSDTEGAYTSSFASVTENIFRSVRYRVGQEERTGDGWEVTVSYQPLDVLPRFVEKLAGVSSEIEKKAEEGVYSGTEEEISQAVNTEYLIRALEVLQSAYLEGEYGEEETYTFHLTRQGTGISMENEEITDFMERILELDNLPDV